MFYKKSEYGLLGKTDRFALLPENEAMRFMNCINKTTFFQLSVLLFLCMGCIRHEKPDRLTELRSLFEQGIACEKDAHPQRALVLFKEAAGIAEELNDAYWQSYLYSKLGFLYLKEYNRPTAQEYFDRSLQAGKELRIEESDTGYRLQFGRTFLFAHKPALALSYFESIRPQVKPGDTYYATLLRSIGLACFQIGRHGEAIEALEESLRYETDAELRMISQMTLFELFADRKDNLQTAYYKEEVEKLLPEVSNLDLHQEFYRICSFIYAQNGDYHQAFDEMTRSYSCEDNKLDYLGRLSVDEGVLLSYQRKMSSENRQLKSDNRWLWIAIGGSWGMIALIVFLFKRHRRHKFYELEHKIELLEEMTRTNSEKSDDLKSLIIRDLEIIKRIALYKSQHSRDTSFVDQFNRLVTIDTCNPFELEWKRLYGDIDHLYGGFYTKLNRMPAGLTEKELQLCCLMKAGFKTDEVAAIWNQSVYSVQKYRSNIRRKLDTPEGADIIQFLKERGC